MKAVISEGIEKRLISLVPQIECTYPTMKSYIETGKFSAAICLQIEQITGGEIPAHMLRPDLFIALPAHEKLAKSCTDNFVDYMNDGKHELIIAVLNFIEARQPKLHKQTLKSIAKLEGGKIFVAQRLAHRDEIG